MADTSRFHVGVRVIDPEKRDTFHGLPEELQESWQSTTGRQDDAGTDSEYTVDLSPTWVETFAGASNLRYLAEVHEVEAHDLHADVEVLEEQPSGANFPDAAEAKYHRVDGLEDEGYDGEGVVFFNLDTGCSPKVEAMHTVAGKRNFSGGDENDITDRQGHGSMTISLQVPRKGRLYILKVLGDNGGGSSDGIARAIRFVGDYARDNKSVVVLANLSLGRPNYFEKFQPYVEAIAYAEQYGVDFTISAGNDGKYGISPPGNSKDGIASIAFDTKDNRASFSNHHETAGVASVGYQAVVINKEGMLAKANGTSFSSPWENRIKGMLATPKKRLGSIQMIHAASRSNARDSALPPREEGHGVIDGRRVIEKLKASAPIPGVTPAPKPKRKQTDPREGELPEWAKELLERLRQQTKGGW